MEFIDISQLSFIQDLGPKGLYGHTLFALLFYYCLTLINLFILMLKYIA